MSTDNIIKNRKTQKIMAKTPWPVLMPSKDALKLVNELLELASAAPYHYKCHDTYQSTDAQLKSCLPFRFHILDSASCRQTSDFLEREKIAAGKVKNMLDAANILMLVTWLPEHNDQDTSPSLEKEPLPFEGNLKNMEHIAAASAAIQNVLIGATARKIPNYWSSGGKLREKPLRTYLNIPLSEVLLGAVFLFPSDAVERNATIKPGANRQLGKDQNTWSRWVHAEDDNTVR